jgi:2,5-diketo-D-gluconate reductase A
MMFKLALFLLLSFVHAGNVANVRCQSPENCLQLNIPGGFDSPFWKSMGYKYNTTEHPECKYVKCDLNIYPHISSITHDVSGFKGVDLVKYGKPPVVVTTAATTSSITALMANTTSYTCGTCGHVYNAAADGGGVPFEQLPDSWTCPVCGSPKSAYKPSTDANGNIIWVEEHDHNEEMNKKDEKVEANTTSYTCGTCGHVYNAAADGGGVPFEQLPDSWTCPVCGSPKSAYKPSTDANGNVIWVEEHDHHDDDDSTTDTPTVTLSNGVIMPVIAAGTWEYSANTAQAAVTAALQAGFTHVDTAHDYCGDGTTGNCKSKSNQLGIQKALKGLERSKYFLTTKVPGCGLQGISRNNCGEDSVNAALDNLKELNIDYTDLLLVHFPPPLGCGQLNCDIIKAQWKALTDGILKTNKTRALGVSNFCISCFKCLLGNGNAPTPGVEVPVLNQVQYHIGMGPDPQGLMTYCKKNNIIVEAYSPLGDNTSELIHGPVTTSIGKNHNKSSVQVALKWIWQHGHPLTTKSSNPVHLEEDIDLFDWTLTNDEMEQLDELTSPKGNPSFMCSK